jgi:myosin XVIII
MFFSQELAVRCIQRNVKAFMQVRDWPWWRLLVRVTPLLNVHRTEEQLKIATDELHSLKTKMEKLEGDRNMLKTENSKLESKVSPSTRYSINFTSTPVCGLSVFFLSILITRR